MSENQSEASADSRSERRNLALALGVIAGLGIIVVALVVIIFVDPFGWNLLSLGEAENAARAIPADAAFYVSLNMGNITCKELNPISWAFSEELKQNEECALDRLIEDLDKSLQESSEFTYTEDIKPWIGDSMAVAIRNFDMNFYGDFEDVGMVFVVEVRDRAAADEFLSKAMDALAEETGEQFMEETYQEVSLYYVEAEGDMETIVLSRSGDMIIFGVGKDDVMAAIDAQQGESLADLPGFKDVISELPRGRMMSYYMDSSRVMEMSTGLFGDLSSTEIPEAYNNAFELFPYAGAGFSIVDEGIRIDTVTLLDRESEQEETIAAKFPGLQPRTQDLMPEDTLFYFVGSGLNTGLDDFKENLGLLAGTEDYEEALLFFEMAFGFDPVDDLLAKLDGEWAFGLMPSSEGILAAELDTPLGFVFVAETSDTQSLLQVSEEFSSRLELQAVGEVEKIQTEEITLFDILDMFTGDSVITYGVSQDHFLLGSSANTLEGLFIGGPSLSESDRYQQVWKAFPRNMRPVMYLDIQGLLAAIRENMSPSVRDAFDQDAGVNWKRIISFAMAGTQVEKGMMKAAMILFIDTD